MQIQHLPRTLAIQMPREEVDRMTMQMIVKARDGYILASDRKMVDEQETRTSMHTDKIKDLPDEKVAYMAAGDDCAIRAAYDFRDAVRDGQFPLEDIERSLRELCDKRWRRENDEFLAERGTGLPEYGRRLLVFFYGLRPAQAWQATINKNSDVHRMKSQFARAGASNNTAWFFMNRYLDSSKSVSELLPLVVHALSMGHALDWTLVDGIQILVYRDNAEKLTPITDAEVGVLTKRSDELDQHIGKWLTSST